jgi:hypothetical protein
MQVLFNVGDRVDVRFKDLTGEITWIPGTVVGFTNDYEVNLDDNPFRFSKVYVVEKRLRKHEEETK